MTVAVRISWQKRDLGYLLTGPVIFLMHISYATGTAVGFFHSLFRSECLNKSDIKDYEIIKRCFDLSVSGCALLFLSPLFLIIALLIKADSPGNVFYKGKRSGRHGNAFFICKFRTMIENADKIGSPVTTKDDNRITRAGKILRRSKLDELPNLFNVFLGDMSLVGPRPESPVMVQQYNTEQSQVLNVKPGIACIAQIRYPNEQALLSGNQLNETEYVRHMKDKLDLDLLYVKTASFFGDLLILFFTFLAVFGIQIDLESFFHRRRMLCHLKLK
jgi:lipopolysaccharide/colanic/teichoic acid biosynthesis glycosyltransferase